MHALSSGRLGSNLTRRLARGLLTTLVCGWMIGVKDLRAEEQPRPCVFCGIVAGTRPAEVVFRDDICIAFMTVGPRNPGHLLVVPLVHADNFLEAPPDTVAHLARVARRMAWGIREAGFQSEAFQIETKAGAAAGQTVFHLHVHVVPRFTGEVLSQTGDRPTADGATLAHQAARIREALARVPAP